MFAAVVKQAVALPPDREGALSRTRRKAWHQPRANPNNPSQVLGRQSIKSRLPSSQDSVRMREKREENKREFYIKNEKINSMCKCGVLV